MVGYSVYPLIRKLISARLLQATTKPIVKWSPKATCKSSIYGAG